MMESASISREVAQKLMEAEAKQAENEGALIAAKGEARNFLTSLPANVIGSAIVQALKALGGLRISIGGVEVEIKLEWN